MLMLVEQDLAIVSSCLYKLLDTEHQSTFFAVLSSTGYC